MSVVTKIPFAKMHGLGNDFVVIDGRQNDLGLIPAEIRRIADRHIGIGCDQVILLEAPRHVAASVFMRIYNTDGSESGACGNATRCIAALVAAETGRTRVVVETIAGLLPCQLRPDCQVTVDMGPARLDWADIPLARDVDTLAVDLDAGALGLAVCTGMGNPHATLFVRDLDAINVAEWGAKLEQHKLFPARANIGFAELIAPDRLRLKVWERGAGLTLACGSGACATLVAAARRGLTGRRGEILMQLGSLSIEWREDGHVLMTGPVATSFSGMIERNPGRPCEF